MLPPLGLCLFQCRGPLLCSDLNGIASNGSGVKGLFSLIGGAIFRRKIFLTLVTAVATSWHFPVAV